MSSVISAHGLTKSFAGRPVVRRLDLEVPQGAIYAFLGDNGAGKTTTIRMLMGLLPPDAGQAAILGLDCWKSADALRHRLGYVAERPRFYDWMTVAEIGWFAGGFHRPGYRERFLVLAERFRLDAAAKLRDLSKGGYAQVGLALALAHEPEVLILDEPTSGLDLFIRREFLTNMVDLAGAGRTILVSSHSVAELERVASHAAFLAEGRILLAGTLDELRRRLVRIRLRFEGPPPELIGLDTVLEQETAGRQWQAVVQDLDRAALEAVRGRGDLFDVEEIPLSLEEMYTALLGRFRLKGAPPREYRAGPDQEPVAAGAKEGGR